MLKNQRTIVALTVIEDKKTGLTSFINVIDAFEVPRQNLGKVVPLRVVADLVGDGTYEFQVLWRCPSIDIPATDIVKMTVAGGSRIHIPALKLPDEFGAYEVLLCWRAKQGCPWSAGASSHYMVLRPAQADIETPETPAPSGV